MNETYHRTPGEIASILKTDSAVIARVIEAGELRARWFDDDWQVTDDDLTAWLDSRRTRA